MERALRDQLPKGQFGKVAPTHRRVMQAVKGIGNRTTERRFRGALARAGIGGWKLNVQAIQGCPDFFFPRHLVAIFLDGCFWHGCPLCGHVPKRNRKFWAAKIARNEERDKKTTRLLKQEGILVLRFWEHELKSSLPVCIRQVKRALRLRSKARVSDPSPS